MDVPSDPHWDPPSSDWPFLLDSAVDTNRLESIVQRTAICLTDYPLQYMLMSSQQRHIDTDAVTALISELKAHTVEDASYPLMGVLDGLPLFPLEFDPSGAVLDIFRQPMYIYLFRGSHRCAAGRSIGLLTWKTTVVGTCESSNCAHWLSVLLLTPVLTGFDNIDPVHRTMYIHADNSPRVRPKHPSSPIYSTRAALTVVAGAFLRRDLESVFGSLDQLDVFRRVTPGQQTWQVAVRRCLRSERLCKAFLMVVSSQVLCSFRDDELNNFLGRCAHLAFGYEHAGAFLLEALVLDPMWTMKDGTLTGDLYAVLDELAPSDGIRNFQVRSGTRFTTFETLQNDATAHALADALNCRLVFPGKYLATRSLFNTGGWGQILMDYMKGILNILAIICFGLPQALKMFCRGSPYNVPPNSVRQIREIGGTMDDIFTARFEERWAPAHTFICEHVYQLIVRIPSHKPGASKEPPFPELAESSQQVLTDWGLFGHELKLLNLPSCGPLLNYALTEVLSLDDWWILTVDMLGLEPGSRFPAHPTFSFPTLHPRERRAKRAQEEHQTQKLQAVLALEKAYHSVRRKVNDFEKEKSVRSARVKKAIHELDQLNVNPSALPPFFSSAYATLVATHKAIDAKFAKKLEALEDRASILDVKVTAARSTLEASESETQSQTAAGLAELRSRALTALSDDLESARRDLSETVAEIAKEEQETELLLRQLEEARLGAHTQLQVEEDVERPAMSWDDRRHAGVADGEDDADGEFDVPDFVSRIDSTRSLSLNALVERVDTHGITVPTDDLTAKQLGAWTDDLLLQLPVSKRIAFAALIYAELHPVAPTPLLLPHSNASDASGDPFHPNITILHPDKHNRTQENSESDEASDEDDPPDQKSDSSDSFVKITPPASGHNSDSGSVRSKASSLASKLKLGRKKSPATPDDKSGSDSESASGRAKSALKASFSKFMQKVSPGKKNVSEDEAGSETDLSSEHKHKSKDQPKLKALSTLLGGKHQESPLTSKNPPKGESTSKHSANVLKNLSFKKIVKPSDVAPIEQRTAAFAAAKESNYDVLTTASKSDGDPPAKKGKAVAKSSKTARLDVKAVVTPTEKVKRKRVKSKPDEVNSRPLVEHNAGDVVAPAEKKRKKLPAESNPVDPLPPATTATSASAPLAAPQNVEPLLPATTTKSSSSTSASAPPAAAHVEVAPPKKNLGRKILDASKSAANKLKSKSAESLPKKGSDDANSVSTNASDLVDNTPKPARKKVTNKSAVDKRVTAKERKRLEKAAKAADRENNIRESKTNATQKHYIGSANICVVFDGYTPGAPQTCVGVGQREAQRGIVKDMEKSWGSEGDALRREDPKHALSFGVCPEDVDLTSLTKDREAPLQTIRFNVPAPGENFHGVLWRFSGQHRILYIRLVLLKALYQLWVDLKEDLKKLDADQEKSVLRDVDYSTKRQKLVAKIAACEQELTEKGTWRGDYYDSKFMLDPTIAQAVTFDLSNNNGYTARPNTQIQQLISIAHCLGQCKTDEDRTLLIKSAKSDNHNSTALQLLTKHHDATSIIVEMYVLGVVTDVKPKTWLDTLKTTWALMNPFLIGGVNIMLFLASPDPALRMEDTTEKEQWNDETIADSLRKHPELTYYEVEAVSMLADTFERVFDKVLEPVMDYFALGIGNSPIWDAAFETYRVTLTDEIQELASLHSTESMRSEQQRFVLRDLPYKLGLVLSRRIGTSYPFTPPFAGAAPILCKGYVRELHQLFQVITPSVTMICSVLVPGLGRFHALRGGKRVNQTGNVSTPSDTCRLRDSLVYYHKYDPRKYNAATADADSSTNPLDEDVVYWSRNEDEQILGDKMGYMWNHIISHFMKSRWVVLLYSTTSIVRAQRVAALERPTPLAKDAIAEIEECLSSWAHSAVAAGQRFCVDSPSSRNTMATVQLRHLPKMPEAARNLAANSPLAAILCDPRVIRGLENTAYNFLQGEKGDDANAKKSRGSFAVAINSQLEYLDEHLSDLLHPKSHLLIFIKKLERIIQVHGFGLEHFQFWYPLPNPEVRKVPHHDDGDVNSIRTELKYFEERLQLEKILGYVAKRLNKPLLGAVPLPREEGDKSAVEYVLHPALQGTLLRLALDVALVHEDLCHNAEKDNKHPRNANVWKMESGIVEHYRAMGFRIKFAPIEALEACYPPNTEFKEVISWDGEQITPMATSDRWDLQRKRRRSNTSDGEHGPPKLSRRSDPSNDGDDPMPAPNQKQEKERRNGKSLANAIEIVPDSDEAPEMTPLRANTAAKAAHAALELENQKRKAEKREQRKKRAEQEELARLEELARQEDLARQKRVEQEERARQKRVEEELARQLREKEEKKRRRELRRKRQEEARAREEEDERQELARRQLARREYENQERKRKREAQQSSLPPSSVDSSADEHAPKSPRAKKQKSATPETPAEKIRQMFPARKATEELTPTQKATSPVREDLIESEQERNASGPEQIEETYAEDDDIVMEEVISAHHPSDSTYHASVLSEESNSEPQPRRNRKGKQRALGEHGSDMERDPEGTKAALTGDTIRVKRAPPEAPPAKPTKGRASTSKITPQLPLQSNLASSSSGSSVARIQTKQEQFTVANEDEAADIARAVAASIKDLGVVLVADSDGGEEEEDEHGDEADDDEAEEDASGEEESVYGESEVVSGLVNQLAGQMTDLDAEESSASSTSESESD
ncbi:hypothetical protein C8R43DRAFT_1156489 [Mycena crocata]|nr:hypothetical protein C8R43DRAFT_1156489 [Mycena crocata]